jgi:hypothetical protein
MLLLCLHSTGLINQRSHVKLCISLVKSVSFRSSVIQQRLQYRNYAALNDGMADEY